MNIERRRPLSVGPIRAFEAVARLSSFRAAADEMHLTQSAVSRQIKSLEEELGTLLFVRGTRSVEITADGKTLLRGVGPALARLDQAVHQLRLTRGRQRISVTTFASFASLWLIPRLEAFQRDHPDIDIRVSASDVLVELDDPDLDIALRYGGPGVAPADATRLFGERLTPVISPWLAEQIGRGQASPLRRPADLTGHTLAEEDDHRPSAEYLSWRHWLAQRGSPTLQPRRWLYFNFTYQQVQAALAGQAVALARVPLVAEALARGDLIEPFGAEGRLDLPHAYWLIAFPGATAKPEVQLFIRWLMAQAQMTCELMEGIR